MQNEGLHEFLFFLPENFVSFLFWPFLKPILCIIWGHLIISNPKSPIGLDGGYKVPNKAQ